MGVEVRGNMVVLYYPICSLYLGTRLTRGCDVSEVIAV